jgi:hypothetical protein
MKAVMVLAYLVGAAMFAVGSGAGWQHQCGTEVPVQIYGLATIWPAMTAWAAGKNGDPLYKCPAQQPK